MCILFEKFFNKKENLKGTEMFGALLKR